MSQCVTIDVSRTITVAEGVFGPGHVGELTQVVPFELVDAVLEETRTVQRRLRDLPSRVGVYFVLALGLFEQVGAMLVWQKLVAGLRGVPVVTPSEKALRDLRRRLGSAPFKTLFGVLAVPLAQPSTAGVRYRRWRTVAFDGCASLKVPDHDQHRGWLGKRAARLGTAGYPALMLMTLVETGTRGLLGAVFGPAATGETAYATGLLPLLNKDMLLLTDRGFDGNQFLAAVVATQAQLLTRATALRRPPVLAVLPDGSYLTRIAGQRLRVIEAQVRVSGADGSHLSESYRLLTTLTDPHTDPADALVRLYHERWEIESAFYALRHTLLRGRVLRSTDPAGLEQEMWALLVLYQALRQVMVTAVETRPGTDPDRAAFTIAVEAARDSVVTATGITPTTPAAAVDLVGRIGAAVLAALLPPRRPRYSARTVKCGISRYHTWNADARPRNSTAITALQVAIHRRAQPPPHPPQTPTPSTPATPTPPRGERINTILGVLRSTPGHPWKARDLARHLGDTSNLNSYSVQMSGWARHGLIHKVAPATYTITERA